jgi:hypothetical protein
MLIMMANVLNLPNRIFFKLKFRNFKILALTAVIAQGSVLQNFFACISDVVGPYPQQFNRSQNYKILYYNIIKYFRHNLCH